VASPGVCLIACDGRHIEWSWSVKKLFVTSLKIGVSIGIIAYLVYTATQAKGPDGRNVFEQLYLQQKQWGMLAAACLACTSAVMLTMIRWWYLVLALDIPLRLKSALRMGLLGYLFNLAPLGIVGGDLVKAWMLAAHHQEDRAKAIASVVVDRIIGLYMLFVVASVAILLSGFWRIEDEEGVIYKICIATFVVTVIGAIAVAALMMPGITDGRGTRALARLPRVGHTIENLIKAVRMYRQRPMVLFVAAVMSVGVHSLFATGVYLIARGLPGDVLSLGTHFVINPLSASTGILPLPFGGFELLLELFYMNVPEPGVTIQAGQGLVVALGYRLICILIAMVGACYYLGSRSEVVEAIREAEQEEESE
jgi:uncharacterized protein (TIRG00374 family)